SYPLTPAAAERGISRVCRTGSKPIFGYHKILHVCVTNKAIDSRRVRGYHRASRPRPNAMKSSRSKRRKRKASIISSIRRPLAPPGHPLTQAKPDEKARPAGRKAKHKQRPETIDS